MEKTWTRHGTSRSKVHERLAAFVDHLEFIGRERALCLALWELGIWLGSHAGPLRGSRAWG